MRAQVSVFIILGLLLLVVAGLSFLAYETIIAGLDDDVEAQYRITNDIEPVRLYIENCMQQAAKEPAIMMGLGGGMIEPSDYRMYDGQKYAYHFKDGASILLLRQDMEAELADAMMPGLLRCIDLSVFERQGFEINTGDMEISTTIARDEIGLRLSYPVQLSGETLDLDIDDFYTELDVPLGRLFEASLYIANSEASAGYFDHISFMQGSEIVIEKHRPYPDIIYNLTVDNFVFRFALQDGESGHGCCYNQYDNACYMNAVEEECTGVYDSNPVCQCPSIVANEEVKARDDCRGHDDGSSWCVYEGIAGQGYDLVGSRHYVHYCIDGREYYEDCRDYREELCTEEIVDGTSKAVCRPNRQEDCASCTTKGCCEDRTYRDCDWKEWSDAKGKCVPFVPIGSRFWEGNAMCSQATQTKECEGFSCPNKWVDDAAIYCYMQGDCGNYRNVEGTLTKGGYFNSDMADIVRDYAYIDNYARTENDINLGISNRQTTQLMSEPDLVTGFTDMLNMLTDYIERMTDISPSHFLNPFSDTKFTIIDIALCDSWKPPEESRCGDCQGIGHRCTEYRCMSLGSDCMYYEEEGFPVCTVRQNDFTVPQISAKAGISMPDSLRMGEFSFVGIDAGTLEPYSLMEIELNTTEETLCRASFLPKVDYLNAPSYYLGQPDFAVSRNVSMRLPGRLSSPRALAAINVSSFVELVDLIEEPMQFLSTYKSEYGKYNDIFSDITGIDIFGMLSPHAEKLLAVMDKIGDSLPYYKALANRILADYEQGKYYMFIECNDLSGNTAEYFISFTVSDVDDKPPVILGFTPENNTLSGSDKVQVYLNEPAECRYDSADKPYDAMNNSMGCYTRSSRFHGSYVCSARINEPVFIRCRDRPDKEYPYVLRVEKGPAEKTFGLDEPEYVNVSGGLISMPADISQSVSFVVANDTFDVAIYTDASNCTLSGMEMECSESEFYHLGSNVCRKEISMNDNLTERTMLLSVEGGAGPDIIKLNFSDATVMAESMADVTLFIEGRVECDGMRCVTHGNTTCYGLYEIGEHEITCRSTLEDFSAELEGVCFDKMEDRNTNLKGEFYIFYPIPPVEITFAGPEGDAESRLVLLRAETNVPARCGYYQDLELGTQLMENVTGTYHEATVELDYERHVYQIVCRDSYGNSDNGEIEFYVFDD